jgi:hypothetical protein
MSSTLYEAPGRRGPFGAVILEAERRPVRRTSVEVIDNTPDSPMAEPSIGAPGSVTLFVGQKNSGALDRLRSALATGRDARAQAEEGLRGITGGVARGPDLARAMIEAPVFADLVYAGQILNRGIFVPEGSDLVMAVFPYNGGRLAGEGFSLVEYYQEGSDAALEALVVQVRPPLSAAEQAALEKVPRDQDARNVGPARWCDTTWWDLAYLAVSVTFAVLCVAPAPATNERISEETLERLDPTASARELLAFRRSLLRDDPALGLS